MNNILETFDSYPGKDVSSVYYKDYVGFFAYIKKNHLFASFNIVYEHKCVYFVSRYILQNLWVKIENILINNIIVMLL